MHDGLGAPGELINSVEHRRGRAALMSDDAILYERGLRSCFKSVPGRFGYPSSSRARTLL